MSSGLEKLALKEEESDKQKKKIIHGRKTVHSFTVFPEGGRFTLKTV